MRISLEWPLAAAFALGFALAGVSPAGRGKTSRHYTSDARGRRRRLSAGHSTRRRPTWRRTSDAQKPLAFTVQDAQGGRFGRECEICGGDNCSGHVQRLNFDLAQDRQLTTRGSANKLNPKRLRRRSEDALQFV